MRWRPHNADRTRWAAALLLSALAATAIAAGTTATNDAAASRVPRPLVERGTGDRCVEDTAFMRRNHMKLLEHQRDGTVHEGIRTQRYSLNGCIECHASRDTGRVIGSDRNFCQGCHSYAAVRLDCFECHASKAKTATAATENRGQGITPSAASLPNAQPGAVVAADSPLRTAR